MGYIITIIGVIFAIILSLLGIERRKASRLSQKLDEAKQAVHCAEKEKKIIEKHEELVVEQFKEEMVEEKKVIETKEEIEEAESEKHVIDIANNFITDFNRMSDS